MFILIFASVMLLVRVVLSQPWWQKPTYQDFCSMDSAQNNKGRGVADLPLPLSLLYYKVEESLALLSQTIGLIDLIDLILLCW